MKHVTAISRKPAVATIPINAIISAISAVLSVLADVLGTKEGA